MKSTLFAAAIAIVLSGCATTPTPTSSARPVPSDRVLAPQYFHRHDAGDVEVIVKRDQGFSGGGTGIVLHLDGKPVAKLASGEIVRLYLPPGRYLLGVIPTVNVGSHSLQETEAVVTPGSLQVYRIHTSSGGDMAFHISRTSQ
jgi:hypothetical protein